MRALAILPFLAVASAMLVGCNGATNDSHDHGHEGHEHEGHDHEGESKTQGSTASLTKLITKDTTVGTGQTAATEDIVSVTYTGRLKNGTVFDSNDKPDGDPFTFRLGAGSVIKGWDQGVAGMKVGGVRELEIPYTLAYGEEGRPPQIPAKSDLYFTVKLLDVIKKGEENVYDAKDTKVGKGRAVKKGDKISVQYTGKLVNDKVFDSNVSAAPLKFKVGAGEVIPGFDDGVVGMKVGGERRLRIPPMLGYGMNNPTGGPSGTLIFEIKLLGIE